MTNTDWSSDGITQNSVHFQVYQTETTLYFIMLCSVLSAEDSPGEAVQLASLPVSACLFCE